MKKFAVVSLLILGAAMISSCASSRGGGGKGQKCPAYSSVDSDQSQDSRS